MTNKKWATLLVLISIPLSYYGFSNFEAGSSEPLEAVLISLACTGGIACFFGGLYLFFTKEKGRGESLLVSQTTVKDPPIQKEVIKQPTKKVNKMAKTTSTSVEMMKREKELETRRKELEGLLEEVRHEETELEQALQTKGWIKKDGEWKVPQSK